MANYDVITTKAINYMQLEYPSLNKYRYKIAVIIYEYKDNIPNNVNTVDLINCMATIINMFLVRDGH